MALSGVSRQGAIETALWSVGLVAPLGLLGGLLSFRWVTRPLSRLTTDVQAQEQATRPAADGGDAEAGPAAKPVRDEIAILRQAFERPTQSNQRHWQYLAQQDQPRREWLAHISHDLRTPLATMQGYLETVLLKAAALTEAEREHDLCTALSESQRLSRLAQGLLALVRLELGAVKPALEAFSIVELAQDVMQKLALSASARRKRLVPDFMPGAGPVLADIGMIERVLTNLLDNAIRHTPPGGEICVRLRADGARVRVGVADQGPGIPVELWAWRWCSRCCICTAAASHCTMNRAGVPSSRSTCSGSADAAGLPCRRAPVTSAGAGFPARRAAAVPWCGACGGARLRAAAAMLHAAATRLGQPHAQPHARPMHQHPEVAFGDAEPATDLGRLVAAQLTLDQGLPLRGGQPVAAMQQQGHELALAAGLFGFALHAGHAAPRAADVPVQTARVGLGQFVTGRHLAALLPQRVHELVAQDAADPGRRLRVGGEGPWQLQGGQQGLRHRVLGQRDVAHARACVAQQGDAQGIEVGPAAFGSVGGWNGGGETAVLHAANVEAAPARSPLGEFNPS